MPLMTILADDPTGGAGDTRAPFTRRGPVDAESGQGLQHFAEAPDRGTVFDRAWKGIANPESLVEAIPVAMRMVTLALARP